MPTGLDLSVLAAKIARRLHALRKDANMRAWIYQRAEQVRKFGADNAPWYVAWHEPGRKRRNKSCGPGLAGHDLAEEEAKRLNAELVSGTYHPHSAKTWKDFRKEYEKKIASGLSPRTVEEIATAFNWFERLVKASRIATISAETIDAFIAARRETRGKQPGSKASAATINKELRHLRAAFAKARKWRYIREMPDFDMQRTAQKLVRYITPEDFDKLYDACQYALLPSELPCAPCDWWRGLIVMAYMTGWRIGELLALKRADVDLNNATAITRAKDNKGKRDELIDLHPLVVNHLRTLRGFSDFVFPWESHKRELYDELHRLEKVAGIPAYCFHDFRRAFATMNADRISPTALQKLMRHRSFNTTLGYIEKARQMKKAVGDLFVPELRKAN